MIAFHSTVVAFLYILSEMYLIIMIVVQLLRGLLGDHVEGAYRTYSV